MKTRLPDGIHRVVFGEFTRAELRAPSMHYVDNGEYVASDQSSEDAMVEILRGCGAQAVTFVMNGVGSPEADRANSEITRRLNENGLTHQEREALSASRIFTGVALMPEDIIHPDYRIIE